MGLLIIPILGLLILAVVACLLGTLLVVSLKFLPTSFISGIPNLHIKAFLTPVAAVAYTALCFIVYCVMFTVRGVYPLSADPFSVKLSNRYSATLTGTPKTAEIDSPSGIPVVSKITDYTTERDWVFGHSSGTASYFLLNTQTGTRTRFQSANELKSALTTLGLKSSLEPAATAYQNWRRNSLIALFCSAIPPSPSAAYS